MADEPIVGAPTDGVPEPGPTGPGAGEPGTAPVGGATLGDRARAVAMAASVGAAVIHFALAPAHFAETTSHGVFFLTVAWLQLGAALALGRWRRRPEPWPGAVAIHGGVLLVWLGSRTAGLPEPHHEGVGLPDTVAAGSAAVVVLSAVVALWASLSGRAVGRAHPLATGLAGVALVGLVSVSVTPSMAGDHDDGVGGHDMAAMQAAGDDGHGHGGHAPAAQVPDAERCDLGVNTAAYNDVAVPGAPHHTGTGQVDFTIEEWAEVFVDPGPGGSVAPAVDYINGNTVMREAILMGEVAHTLDPEPWNALTDPEDCDRLASELEVARRVAAAHPTVADAEAAGWEKVTDYLPGIGAHYLRPEYVDGDFVAGEPEMLLYDDHTPDAPVVGLSYFLLSEGGTEPTDGFTGDNDHYHRHTGLCIRDGVVVAGSNVTDAECAAVGGEKGDGTGGWMSHVWVVPGCESDWGVFSGANAALTVRMQGGARATGCGTGRTPADPLAFEPPSG